MSGFKPNEHQRRAIDAVGGQIVVNAGAGSGKTAVLAARCAEMLAGGGDRDPVEPGRILAITFTRKAAGELRERIRRAVRSDPRLGEEAARKSGEAWISTIDAFCARLLRAHSLDLGRTPDVRFADEIATGRLQEQAARVACEAIARSGATGRAFVDAHGWAVLARSLSRDLGRLRSMGRRPEDIGRGAATALDSAATRLSDHAREVVSRITELPVLKPAHKRNLALATDALKVCGCGEKDDGVFAARASGTLGGRTFNRAANPKQAVADAAASMERLCEACADILVAPYAQAYRSLLVEFEATYARLKGEAGLIDYADALESARTLVGRGAPFEEEYRERFQQVMIDEFQDTNEQQMRVLGPVATGTMFVVGDVQQSIHGFRYADVDVMRRRVSSADRVEALPVNYRSHPEILGFVNAAFSGPDMLGEDFLALEPGREEFAGPWPTGTPRVELAVFDTRSATRLRPAEGMAFAVAHRVHEVIGHGFDPADVVVLLRAMTHAARVSEALEERGIPAHVASGESLFEQPEVVHVLALLEAVVTPHDDAALLKLLTGPLCRLDDSTLLGLRVAARDLSADGVQASLYRAMDRVERGQVELAFGDPGAVASAVRRIRDTRALQRDAGVGRAVAEAVRVFGAASGEDEGGSDARSLVGRVIELAEEFEESHGGDVGRFLEHLEARERYVAREVLPEPGGAGRAVRIMSVHAAKGLEFPVVVVAGLQARLTSPHSEPMLVERIGDDVVLSVQYPPDGSELERIRDSNHGRISRHRAESDEAEEIRILYVACTRAEEALLLVGAGDPERLSPTTAQGRLSAMWGPILEEGSAVAGDVVVRTRVLDEGSVRPDGGRAGPVADRGAEADGRGGPATEEGAAADQGHPAAATRPESPPLTVDVPRRVSYSALHRLSTCPFRFYVQDVANVRSPGSGDPGAGPCRSGPAHSDGTEDARAVGTAVHAALELLDQLGAAAALATVEKRFSLSDEARSRVAEALEGFAGSKVAGLFSARGIVRREEPFQVDLGPTELVGTIDAIAWDGREALVVDYKTGTDERLSRSPARMQAYELQARCYALAALEAGARQVRVVFCFVEQGGTEVEFDLDHSDRARIRDDLGRMVIDAFSGSFAARASWDPEVCVECPALGGVCPVDRPPGPDPTRSRRRAAG